MWINERLNNPLESEPPYIGRVARIQGNQADVEGYMKLTGVTCISPFGMECLPAVGEEVLVLPGGKAYYCIGVPSGRSGQTVIQNQAGARISLQGDGSVNINGVIISKDGVLTAPQG